MDNLNLGTIDGTRSTNSDLGLIVPLHYYDQSLEILDIPITSRNSTTILTAPFSFLLFDEKDQLINENYDDEINSSLVRKFLLESWDENNLKTETKKFYGFCRAMHIPINNSCLRQFIINNYLIYKCANESPKVIPKNKQTLYLVHPDHPMELNENETIEEHTMLTKQTHKISQMINWIESEILQGYGTKIKPINKHSISWLPINSKDDHISVDLPRFSKRKCYTSVMPTLFLANADNGILLADIRRLTIDPDIFESTDKRLYQKLAYLSIIDRVLLFLDSCKTRLLTVLSGMQEETITLNGKLSDSVEAYISMGFEEAQRHIPEDKRCSMKCKYIQGSFMGIKWSIPSYLGWNGKFYKSRRSAIIICQNVKYRKDEDILRWNIFAEPETINGETNFRSIKINLHNYKIIELSRLANIDDQ